MTTQTQKFIEPSDIIGLRLECAKCHAILLLPISGEIEVKRLYVCPNCERPWIRLPNGSTAEVEIEQCMAHIKTLNGLLSRGQYNGFLLSLEVKADEDEE